MSQKNSARILDMYPLSPLQQGMVFHTIYEPQSQFYFVSSSYRMLGHLDSAAYERAWKLLIARHDILRTAFVTLDLKKPLQVVFDDAPWTLEHHDWSGLEHSTRERQLRELQQQQRMTPLDFSRPPLLRHALVDLGNDEHAAVVTTHHALVDGWSIGILLSELVTSYRAFARGEQPRLAPVGRYRDYISWLARQDLNEARAYWKRRLDGFHQVNVLGMDKGGKASERNTARHVGRLFTSTVTVQRLEEFARRQRLTINTLLLAVWSVLLGRLSGRKDVVFGVVVSGQPPELLDGTARIGLFMNTLPLRIVLRPDQTAESLLTELHQQQAQLLQFQNSPLVDVQHASEVPAGVSLFDTTFDFANYPVEPTAAATADDVRLGRTNLVEWSHYPLNLRFVVRESLSVVFVYDAKRFDADCIEHVAQQFDALTEDLLGDPKRRLRQLTSTPALDSHPALATFNQTARDYPRHQRVDQLFTEQARRTPCATALLAVDHSMSYAELDQRSNLLAAQLRDLGVGPDVIVGLHLARSFELVIAILAIFKAEGAYLPLDPSYPVERLRFMLADAAPRVIVGSSCEHVLPPNWQGWLVGSGGETRSYGTPARDRASAVSTPDSLAYILYTSGSTGKPKGVMGTHRSIVNRVTWDTEHVSTAEVYAQKTTINFIDVLWELFMPLTRGQSVAVLPPDIERDPSELVRLLGDLKVTRIVLVPSLLRAILGLGADLTHSLPHLKYWACSGEALTTELSSAFARALPAARLLNIYGTSEFWDATWFLANSTHGERAGVPIGHPIANMQVHVLDEYLDPVPLGTVGEIYVAGEGLARGYLNDPALTSQRFIEAPVDRARLYKTSDLARHLPDGSLEFVGRADTQVKIRGHRIEMSEVELSICSFANIKQAVVIARTYAPDDLRLIAYFMSESDVECDTEALRGHLMAQLPAHMIPSAFHRTELFPLLPNGKIDRAALANRIDEANVNKSYVEPTTPTEITVASIWCEILKCSPIGRADNFFSLGGHSLSAMQAVAELRRRMQREIPLSVMFEFSSLQSLAAHLDEANTADAQDLAEELSDTGVI